MTRKHRKILSIFLAAVLLITSGCLSVFHVSAAEVLYGDADGNGKVEVQDALCMQKYIAKAISADEIDLVAANVTVGDQDVNTQDVLYVQQFVAKVIDRFPIENEPTDTVKLIFNVTIPEALPEDANVSIGSNLNSWNPGDTEWFAEKIDDLHYRLEKDVDAEYVGTTIEYKWTAQMEGQQNVWSQVEGGATGGDIDNRTYEVQAGVNEINDTVAMFRSLTGQNTVVGGTLETFTIVMEPYEDGRERTIRVWLPDGYDPEDTEKRYPVLYMHDGQNVFDAYTSFAGEWEVDEAISDMIAGGYEGAIVVGIDNGPERMAEYCPDDWPGSDQTESGSTYARFIVETLKPYIDTHYNTKTDKESTTVGGSSMGGLISYYIGTEYPDVFGNVLVFSPSFQLFGEENVAQMIASQDFSDPDLQPRYFIYAGGSGGEASITKYVDFVKNAMVENGYPEEKINTLVDESQPHSESAWAKYFPQAYSWLVGFEGAPPVEKDYYRIYLDTSYSDWTQAYICMWIGGENIVPMTPVEGQEDVYYYDLPNGQTEFLFRADDDLSQWGSRASENVQFRPANENMVYTFTSGGGEEKYAGEWMTYTPPQKETYRVYFDVSASDWTEAYICMWIGGENYVSMTPVEGQEGVFYYDLPSEQVEFLLRADLDFSQWGAKSSVNITFTPENENMVYVFAPGDGVSKYSGQWQAYTP